MTTCPHHPAGHGRVLVTDVNIIVGLAVPDPTMRVVRKAKKPFGFYHFFLGRNITEADHFIRTCAD